MQVKVTCRIKRSRQSFFFREMYLVNILTVLPGSSPRVHVGVHQESTAQTVTVQVLIHMNIIINIHGLKVHQRRDLGLDHVLHSENCLHQGNVQGQDPLVLIGVHAVPDTNHSRVKGTLAHKQVVSVEMFDLQCAKL